MFRVAHDASRPFIVDAGASRITALGTQFQVQREGEAVSVMLLEGSVGIDSAREGDERRLLRLVPGQRASYAPTTRSWTVATVDPVALTSWSQGFHVFGRSEEHTSELQSLMRISYAVFCLKKKKQEDS